MLPSGVIRCVSCCHGKGNGNWKEPSRSQPCVVARPSQPLCRTKLRLHISENWFPAGQWCLCGARGFPLVVKEDVPARMLCASISVWPVEGTARGFAKRQFFMYMGTAGPSPPAALSPAARDHPTAAPWPSLHTPSHTPASPRPAGLSSSVSCALSP